jgi:transcriptional regulator with XRE-family HTH domain
MAKTVAAWCFERQLSLDQLVERSQLDEQRIAAIAQGRWTPSPDERQQVAAVLGVAVDEIAWGHSTPIQHLYGHGPG